MDTARFKIDFNPGSSRYSAFRLLFRNKAKWGLPFYRWDTVDSFESIEKAREHYEKIKDLPEYLL